MRPDTRNNSSAIPLCISPAYCRSILKNTAIVLLLVLLGAVLPTPALAYLDSDPHLSVNPAERGEGYSAVMYNNTNGLPTSEANDIVETSEGFIWIGSYSGLIRYDGNTFERIDSTTGIASVVSLYADADDRLWVGTNDNGVAVMERGEFRVFNKTNGLRSSSVRAIAQDGSGDIYVGTTQGVVCVNDAYEVEPVEDERLLDAYVRDLRPGPDGVLYGVTMTDEVFALKEGKVICFFSAAELGMPDAISVLPDPERDGWLYVGTKQSSVYHANLLEGFTQPDVIDVSPLSYVKCVERFDDRLWVCADNGIGMVDETGLQLVDNIPLNNSIDHAMADYQGNLWFTSSRQGVMKIVPNQFSDVFGRYGLDETVVNSTCLLGSTLYVGTDSGLMVLGSSGPITTLPLKTAAYASGVVIAEDDLVHMLDGCRIRSVIRDSSNRLWFSTYSDYGLVRYDKGVATCFAAADGLPSSRVRCVFERADHTLLAACTGGVAVIDKDTVTTVYDESAGLSNSEVLTVSEAEDGTVVVGSDGGGIYLVEGKPGGKVIGHVGAGDGLMSDVVMRVKRDQKRNLFWVVTSNSLAYLDENWKATTITEFPYSNNFDLYENDDDEIWVLSSNGIYVTAAEDLLKNDGFVPVYYGRDNGLSCIATANSYSELANNGDLYIAGTTGVAKVNINTPFESVDDIRMAVPFIEVDGKTLYPRADGSFDVPSHASKITIYPFVYTYSLLNPQVSYYLSGLDEHPVTVRRTELTPLDFTNLAGGNYRFVMQLKDAMGHGYQELEVTLHKQMAFTETWWFRFISILSLGLLAAFIVHLRYRRKTRELEAKQEENRIFIGEMIEAFAKTIDMKDSYTNGHSKRVALYTRMLTEELGYDEETVDRYYHIALLHDIGKIGVPDEVLNKPGKLTDKEFGVIKSHSSLGYRVLKDISIMPELAVGAGAHHERPDGRGYPHGLTGEEIPRVAQIIAVADTFDAMYSDRPYRKRMNFEKAVSIIREVSGTQLTPDVVDAFLRLVDKGFFRAPDDTGGGSTEDIDNIHRKQRE